MLTHLREAQADLTNLPTAGDIYNQQPAHQANNIAAITDLVAQRLLDEQAAYAAMPPPGVPASAPPDHLTDVANSLQRRETDLQTRETAMMSQMRDMMMSMMNNNNTNNNNNNNNYNSNRGGRNNNSNRGGRNYQGRGGERSGGRGNTRSTTRLYCWSHGACAHTSVDCNRPATGHQTTATFSNMMEGSKNGCYWIT